jgi:hypothetical protein
MSFVGPARVRIETQGVELTVEDVFSYYNPFVETAFVHGDAIDGTVNVQVFDDAGRPVENAFVSVGAVIDPAQPHRYGYTDFRGQVTLSGPGIVGPADLHAGKPGLGAFSIVQINRSNVNLLLLTPPPPPPDPCDADPASCEPPPEPGCEATPDAAECQPPPREPEAPKPTPAPATPTFTG